MLAMHLKYFVAVRNLNKKIRNRRKKLFTSSQYTKVFIYLFLLIFSSVTYILQTDIYVLGGFINRFLLKIFYVFINRVLQEKKSLNYIATFLFYNKTIVN